MQFLSFHYQRQTNTDGRAPPAESHFTPFVNFCATSDVMCCWSRPVSKIKLTPSGTSLIQRFAWNDCILWRLFGTGFGGHFASVYKTCVFVIASVFLSAGRTLPANRPEQALAAQGGRQMAVSRGGAAPSSHTGPHNKTTHSLPLFFRYLFLST